MAAGQPLRGLVGQSMSGRKPKAFPALVRQIDESLGASSFTATKAAVALIYAWGAGGSGARDGSNVASGGGGGGAGYKRIRITPGQVISWSIGVGGAAPGSDLTDGSPGTATTVTLPTGVVLTAGGGQGGARGSSPRTGGLGGVVSGPWDIARTGGKGGDGVTGASTAGESPVNGGTGGPASGNYGGGAGAAGFTDVGLYAGNGATGNAAVDQSTAPGGGSQGLSNITAYAGKAGRLVILLLND